MRGKVIERLDGSVRPHRRSSGAGRDKPARRAHKPRSRCGLVDEILVVGIDVSIVVGVSIVVVQCGDDGHAPPYRQHMEQHEHGADGENHVGDGPWFRN